MNENERRGWAEIARRTPRKVKVGGSIAVVVAIAAFGAMVAFLVGNVFLGQTAKPVSVAAQTAPTAVPTTAPAATQAPTQAPATNGGRQAPGDMRGPKGGFGFRGFPFLVGNTLDAVAKALNLTTDQVRAQMGQGKSLADIAAAQNVTIQVVKDAITAGTKSSLDALVQAGKLTQDQASMILSRQTANLDQIVNAKFGQHPGFGGPGFGGRHPFGGNGNPAPMATPSGSQS